MHQYNFKMRYKTLYANCFFNGHQRPTQAYRVASTCMVDSLEDGGRPAGWGWRRRPPPVFHLPSPPLECRVGWTGELTGGSAAATSMDARTGWWRQWSGGCACTGWSGGGGWSLSSWTSPVVTVGNFSLARTLTSTGSLKGLLRGLGLFSFSWYVFVILVPLRQHLFFLRYSRR
jgi:hypothetical protein